MIFPKSLKYIECVWLFEHDEEIRRLTFGNAAPRGPFTIDGQSGAE